MARFRGLLGRGSDARGSRPRTLGLAALAGAVIAFAGPPRTLPLLAFFATPLLLAAIEGPHGARTTSARRGLVAGLVMGTVANGIALFWVVGLLETFAHFPLVAALPVALLLWVAQAVPFALAGAGAAALMARRAPGYLVLPATLTVAFSLTPALFPWRPSAPEIPWVPFIQLAEIGGRPLLNLLFALVGCALLEGVRARRPGVIALGAACIVVPLVYGLIRLPEVRAARAAAPALDVGVVQPDVGILVENDPSKWLGTLDELRGMSRILEKEGADVVVWPETAYPFPWARDRVRDPLGALGVEQDGVHGPMLIGAVTVRGECGQWNSTLAIDAKGHVVGVADKVELLAFGEYVPLWRYLTPLHARFPCPGLTPGDAPRTLTLAGTRIAVLNCYEDVLARYTRRVMRQDPKLLVNVTNDAWFGDTAEPWLHALVARMRSVETRRDLVRAVNTGVSSHVLATGEVAYETRPFERTSFIAHARLLDTITPWVRFGDLVTPALAGALLGAVLALRRRRV